MGCTAKEAVERALSIARAEIGQYALGHGGYDPEGPDSPFDSLGCDCSGFVTWCWKLPRHRPGFNRQPRATVEDEINTASILEDARFRGELFCEVELREVQPGDLIVYHRSKDTPVGHVGLIVGVWGDDADPNLNYHHLEIVQCHGPNGFRPGAVQTDGSIWLHHDAIHPDNPSAIVRPKVGP